jgi:hypothetical protein
MLAQIYRKKLSGLAQPAVWTLTLWTALLALIVLGLLYASGDFTLITMIAHPSLSPVHPPVPIASHIIMVSLTFLVLCIGLGPFWVAGTYGTIADVINERPITWKSFWRNSWQCYAKAWGLIGYTVLLTIIIEAILITTVMSLHFYGIMIAMLVMAVIVPVFLRMMGGIFVRNLSWSHSFREIFRASGYGYLWLAVIILVIVGFMAELATGILFFFSPVLGGLFYVVVESALEIVGGVWTLAAYDLTTPTVPAGS